MKLNLQSLLFCFTFCFTSCNNPDQKPAEQIKHDSSAISVPEDSLLTADQDKPVRVTPSKDSVLLRFKLEKGKVYNYDMAQDIQQEADGNTRTNHMHWNYDLKVTDAVDKLETIQVTYKRIDMTMDMGGQKMEFSSESPGEGTFNPLQMLSNMLATLKGKSFTMKVDEQGRITDIQGLDKIGETIVKETNLPEEVKARMLQQFKSQFNEVSIRQMFSQALDIFPDKTVKVGDTWTKTIPLHGDRSQTTQYTVLEIKGTQVKLDAKAKSPAVLRSTYLVDAKTGLVKTGTFTQRMETEKVKMTVKGKFAGKES